jgi:hypothetical protein
MSRVDPLFDQLHADGIRDQRTLAGPHAHAPGQCAILDSNLMRSWSVVRVR